MCYLTCTYSLDSQYIIFYVFNAGRWILNFQIRSLQRNTAMMASTSSSNDNCHGENNCVLCKKTFDYSCEKVRVSDKGLENILDNSVKHSSVHEWGWCVCMNVQLCMSDVGECGWWVHERTSVVDEFAWVWIEISWLRTLMHAAVCLQCTFQTLDLRCVHVVMVTHKMISDHHLLTLRHEILSVLFIACYENFIQIC